MPSGRNAGDSGGRRGRKGGRKEEGEGGIGRHLEEEGEGGG